MWNPSTISTFKIVPNARCFVHFDFEMCFTPQRHALFRRANFQKWSEQFRTWCVLYILTWTCVSRHTGVHFCDISTFKIVPNARCFVHFDFEMCFTPQRHALFRRANFQKWSEQFRAWCVLYILTSKCASRHKGVHFFDMQLRKVVRAIPSMVCFVHFDLEMCFAPHRRALLRHLNF